MYIDKKLLRTFLQKGRNLRVGKMIVYMEVKSNNGLSADTIFLS